MAAAVLPTCLSAETPCVDLTTGTCYPLQYDATGVANPATAIPGHAWCAVPVGELPRALYYCPTAGAVWDTQASNTCGPNAGYDAPNSGVCVCNDGYGVHGFADNPYSHNGCSPSCGAGSCPANNDCGYSASGAITCTPLTCANGHNTCAANELCSDDGAGTITCTPPNCCEGNPCQNGASCTSGATGYTCTCTGRFTGTNCETAPPPPTAGNTFTFTDGAGDDVPATALVDFFTGLGAVAPTDFIFFEVQTGSLGFGGAWCAERADWYVARYLQFAATDGHARSGFWNRYSRAPGGGWSAPDTNGYDNYYGNWCAIGPYDWCSEWGVGGRYLGVMPGYGASPYNGEILANQFSEGRGFVATIRVGATCQDACGF